MAVQQPSGVRQSLPDGNGSSVGERKHLTILFADLVGSTALCERLDPEAVHELIDRWLRLMTAEIYHYGGIVNQFSGDGIMALFGAPVAYEDAPQRACSAALAMQQRLADFNTHERVQLAMRVGIDSGETFVGVLGGDQRKEYAALGHRANLAKRVQEVAEPGGIMLSEPTYQLVQPYFLLDLAGDFPAKGLRLPLRTYRLLGAHAERARLDVTLSRWQPRLVGRERELAQLEQHLEAACGGRRQLIVVEGEAGVGKSRLALELKRMAAERDLCVWEGRGLPYGTRAAYGLFADVLRRFCSIDDGDTPNSAQRKLAQACADLGADVAFLAMLLSLPTADSGLAHLDPETRKTGIFSALRTLLRAQVRRGPLILLLDDFHWADALSRELTDFVLQGTDSLALLCCVLTRPEGAPLAFPARVVRMALPSLGAADITDMVRSVLDLTHDAQSPALCEWIGRVSGGNPLFVEETLQALLADGTLAAIDGAWRVCGDFIGATVPTTVQDLIAARIDRLPETEKLLLRYAAVIGDEFTATLVQRLVGDVAVDAALDELVGSGLVVQSEPGTAPSYRFKHGLTWQVTYNTIARRERARLHERTGQIIEDVHAEHLEPHYALLAHHYGNSSNVAKAVRFLSRAGEQARHAFANADAVAYFSGALEQSDSPLTPRQRLDLLLARGEIRASLLAEYAAALTDFDSAIAVAAAAGDSRGVAQAVVGKGNVFTNQHRLDEALLWFERALTTATLTDCHSEAVEALLHLGLVHGQLGNWTPALERLQAALRLSRERHDDRCEIQALIRIGQLHSNQAEYREALRIFAECIERCRRIDDKISLSFALQSEALVHLALGAHQRVIEVNHSLQSLLTEIGDRKRLANSFFNLGVAWQSLGAEEQAIECYEESLRRFEALGVTYSVKMCLVMLRGLYSRPANTEKRIATLAQLSSLLREEGNDEEAATILAEMAATDAKDGVTEVS